jgi:hypothetical protein
MPTHIMMQHTPSPLYVAICCSSPCIPVALPFGPRMPLMPTNPFSQQTYHGYRSTSPSDGGGLTQKPFCLCLAFSLLPLIFLTDESLAPSLVPRASAPLLPQHSSSPLPLILPSHAAQHPWCCPLQGLCLSLWLSGALCNLSCANPSPISLFISPLPAPLWLSFDQEVVRIVLLLWSLLAFPDFVHVLLCYSACLCVVILAYPCVFRCNGFWCKHVCKA